MKLNFLFFSILLSCLHLNAKELVDLIESDIQEVMTKVIEWRHHFHEYPELSNREFETAKYIKSKLEDMGLNVETEIAHTGLIAMIRGQKEGPLMALRADMDALPVEEKLNLPFSSKVRTVYQGQDVGVMHACGHDAHMAVLLGVAEFLTNNKDKLRGDIMLIFQPAEEGAPEGEEGGAELMLKEGIFKDEKPDAIFGMHVTNAKHGWVALKPGPAMASAEAFRIIVKGKQTHGSRPWSGVDPITAAYDIGSTLQTIVSRRLNILESQAVISVGIIRGGTRNNIIPEEVMLEGTIRTFDEDYRKRIYDEITKIATNIAEAHSAEAEVKFRVYGGYPVTVNDIDLAKMMMPSLSRASNGQFIEWTLPRTGAEDFSFFAQQVPGLFFYLGVNPKDKESDFSNHSPYFYVDDGALINGVKSFIHLVNDYSIAMTN